MGDFNGDGKQDLAVANGNALNGAILLGDGTGGFSPPATLSIGTLPVALAVGDFNGDGKQDLVLANASSDDITVLLGDGNGGFNEPGLRLNVGNSPQSVAIGDFNGDGKQDLAVANGGGPYDISVLLGDGLGGFSAATNFPVNVSPSSVAVGDIDNDGRQDLIAANASSGDVSVLLGTGTGAFGTATNFKVGTNPGSVAVGDFNGDGALDLVTANQGGNNVSVLLRQCQPTLTISNFSGAEGNSGSTNFVFTVTLSSASASDVTVHYATQDGTATIADNDYVALPDTVLTIPAGAATATIQVQVNGDTTYEPDETFQLVLSNPSGATFAGAAPVGTGTIQNDDAAPSFSIDSVAHNEGNSGTTVYLFTVTKAGSTSLSSSVAFATQDGSATIADKDYQSSTGTLNFLPADTTKTITVLVNGDTTFEPNETFTVHLSNPTNATIATADGTGTITNDDDLPIPTTQPQLLGRRR